MAPLRKRSPAPFSDDPSSGLPGTHRRVALLLALLVCLFLLPHLFRTDTILYGWDVVHEKYYWRTWGFGQLQNGQLPLWNPYVLCGFPFATDPVQGTFYPLNFLFLFLPIPLAFSWTIALHLWIGGYFAYRFTSQITRNLWSGLASALVFAFSGFIVGRIYFGSIPQLCTMMWLPCLFYLSECLFRLPRKGYGCLLAFAVGLQCLSGHPQFTFYNLFALSLFLGFRFLFPVNRGIPFRDRMTPILTAMLSILLGVGLGCINFVPLAELWHISSRPEVQEQLFSKFGAFHPDLLLSLVAPDFFGHETDASYWGGGLQAMHLVYVSVVALLLIVIAAAGCRRYRPLTIFCLFLGLLTLLFAMSPFIPGFIDVYKYLPGSRFFRLLPRWLSVSTFAAAVLAGFGLHVLIQHNRGGARGSAPQGKGWSIAGGTFAFTMCLILVLCYFLIPWADLARSETWRGWITGRFHFLPVEAFDTAFLKTAAVSARASLLRPILLLFGCGTLLSLWCILPRKNVLPVFWILFIYLDLLTAGSRFLIPYPVRDLAWDPGVVEFLKSDPDLFRVETWMPVDALPLPGSSARYYRHVNRYNQSYLNRGMLYGIENVGGLFTLSDQRYREFALGSPRHTFENFRIKDQRTADMLNVRYVIAPPGMTPVKRKLIEVYRDSGEVVYRNPDALPRAYIVHRVRTVVADQDALSLMGEPDFAPRTTAVVVGEQEGVWNADCADVKARIRIQNTDPLHSTLEAELSCPGFLVFSENHYPGWRCDLDGRATPIHRTNFTQRGIYLEPGKHRITFEFRPLSFFAGAGISLLSLLIVTLRAIRMRLRNG